MKTIRPGNEDALERYRYFMCDNCGWVGKASKKEYASGQQYNEIYYYLNECPFCKYYSVPEITNEELLKRVKEEELISFELGGYSNET